MGRFSWLACKMHGHKRGKFLREEGGDTFVIENDEPIRTPRVRVFECPRCGRETRYKVKPKPQAQSEPTDGSAHYQELA